MTEDTRKIRPNPNSTSIRSAFIMHCADRNVGARGRRKAIEESRKWTRDCGEEDRP